jgi:hypothetical protein
MVYCFSFFFFKSTEGEEIMSNQAQFFPSELFYQKNIFTETGMGGKKDDLFIVNFH